MTLRTGVRGLLAAPACITLGMNPLHPYGWRPQPPDHRDFKLSLPALPLPDHVDLSPSMPFIFDQGDLGSCTANAISLVVARLQNIQNPHWPFVPSRLFVYYNERALEGTVDQDAGAVIRDGLKTLAKLGVCTEPRWPYIESRFAAKPSPDAYNDALLHRAARYAAVDQTEFALRTALAHGHPVVFGIAAFDALEGAVAASTGYVAMPGPSDASIGGHAIVLCGFDSATRRFKWVNSWGASWGDKGCGYLDFDYVLNPELASDFWVVESLGDKDGVQDG